MDRLQFFILSLAGLIPGFALHEFFHAKAADLLGDSTPRRLGRLSIDPLVHLDVFGTLMIAFTGFGWAKPVPINPANFRHGARDIVLVSIAGPAANLLLVFVFGVLVGLAHEFGVGGAVVSVFEYALLINAALAAFNLLPIPPLDGSRVLAALLPYQMSVAFRQMEAYAPLIILVFFFVPGASSIIYAARTALVRSIGFPGVSVGSSLAHLFR